MNKKETTLDRANRFLDKELDKLKSVSDVALSSFLLSHLSILHKVLIDRKISSKGFENLCIIATSELNHKLREAGFNADILEGNLEMGPKDWLVHRVNLVKLSNCWVVIDLTASQLPWFKERTWLVETTSPDDASLREFLKDNYHWWVGSQ